MTVFIIQLLSSSYGRCVLFLYSLFVCTFVVFFFSSSLRIYHREEEKTTNTLAVTTMPFVVAHLLSHGNCYTNYGDASSVSNMHGNKSQNEPSGEYCLFVPFACRNLYFFALFVRTRGLYGLLHSYQTIVDFCILGGLRT